MNRWKIEARTNHCLAIVLLSSFIFACSPTRDTSSTGSNSLTTCEYLYEAAFTTTFHNFVRTLPRSCTNCHNTPAVSHQFALADASVSFENFLLISSVPIGSGRATDAKNQLRANALDPGHYSAGSATYLTELDSFEASWSAIDAAYIDCVN